MSLEPAIRSEGLIMALTVTVNGEVRRVDVDPDTPLLWVLRDELDLTGTKYGCGQALCGACTVHLDGVASRSCAIAIADADGADVVTIEGVQGRIADAVLAAWEELDVVQCGYCQPGQVMSAIGLLRETAKPTDAHIDAAMSGNLCRCATYVRIRAAIHSAAGRLQG